MAGGMDKARLVVLAGLLSVSLGSGAALAVDHEDHDRAKAALDAGLVLPLGQILKLVDPALRERILDIELEEAAGVLIYEITAIDGNGRRVEVYFDALTGAQLAEDPDDSDPDWYAQPDGPDGPDGGGDGGDAGDAGDSGGGDDGSDGADSSGGDDGSDGDDSSGGDDGGDSDSGDSDSGDSDGGDGDGGDGGDGGGDSD